MNIIQRMYEIHELPTLPEVILKISALINSDEGSAASLSRIMAQDPSLTTKILKVANSSYFGQGNQRISSLSLAIARIGFNEVRNIVTAMSCIKQFSKRSTILDYKLFWRHSLTAAYLTKIITDSYPDKFSAEDRQFLFLTGLLHDIGILVLDQFFHEDFEAILDNAMKNEISFLAAEQAVVGKETHQVVGSALLEFWKLDAAVISGVRFHHLGFEKASSNYRLISIVTYMVEYILCNCSLGSFEGSIAELDKAITETFKITPDGMALLFAAAEAYVDKSDLIIAMGMSGSQNEFRMI